MNECVGIGGMEWKLAPPRKLRKKLEGMEALGKLELPSSGSSDFTDSIPFVQKGGQVS